MKKVISKEVAFFVFLLKEEFLLIFFTTFTLQKLNNE